MLEKTRQTRIQINPEKSTKITETNRLSDSNTATGVYNKQMLKTNKRQPQENKNQLLFYKQANTILHLHLFIVDLCRPGN